MKQRASQIPPPAPTTSPSLAPGAVVTHTLVSLMQRFGVVEQPQVLAYVAHAPIATLVTEGSRVSTQRVLDEGVRIVGVAVEELGRADDTRRALMPTLDEPMLRACVSALATVKSLSVVRVAATDKTDTQIRQRKDARSTLAEQVSARRAILYTAALALAGADPDRRVDLDDAWGSGDDPRHIATSSTALVTIARAIAADARKRGVTVSLTDAWLTELDTLAAKLLKITDRAEGKAIDGEVGQGDVAWWRGISLWFLKQIVDVLDTARASDRRIRAVPLGALRSVFKRSGKPTRKTPAQPAQPTRPA
jgi:hypothetical protein